MDFMLEEEGKGRQVGRLFRVAVQFSLETSKGLFMELFMQFARNISLDILLKFVIASILGLILLSLYCVLCMFHSGLRRYPSGS